MAELVGYIPSIIVLLPLAAWIYRKQFLSNEIKPLVFFLIISATVEYSMLFLSLKGINNLWLAHIYVIVSLPALSTVYYRILSTKIWKRAIIIINTCAIIFSLTMSLWVQPIYLFPTYGVTIDSIFLSLFALGHYYQIYKSSTLIKLEKYPTFWLSTGILLFYGGTLLLHSASNYLLWLSLELSRTSLSLQRILLFLFYTSITISLCLPKQHSTSH